MSNDLALVERVEGFDFTVGVFKRRIAEQELAHIRTASWSCLAAALEPAEGIDIRIGYRGENDSAAFASINSCLCRLCLSDGHLYVVVAGPSSREADEAIEVVRRALPPAPPVGDELRVPMWLWTMTSTGPRKIRREIDVPSWDMVSDNYTASVRTQLHSLMQSRPDAGQIILWHGPPGTGKSFALRALAYEWRKWCSIHYVVDPEVMFGEKSAYLIDFLFDAPQGSSIVIHGEEEHWRLLVLEDTGEMLTMDAKEHVGQGLSRLLNVTDGLIGQGMRILVLVTTNEEVGKLHPAVARPGRCAASTKFAPLTASEAEAWLEARGMHQATGALSIAELYGLVGGYAEPTAKVRPGFPLRRTA